MYETTRFIFGMPIPHVDIYWLYWLCIPLIVFSIYVIQNFKRYSWGLLIYLFGYPLYVAFNQQYGVQDYAFTLHLKYMALGALIPLFLSLFIKDFPEVIALALGVINIIYPVLSNHSMSACMMLCFMAYYGFSWIYVIGILMHPTALGLGGLVFWWCWRRYKVKTLLLFIPVPFLQSIEFFSSSGRFHMWSQIWNWFWERHRIWWGYGPGSFIEYGPNMVHPIEAPDFHTLYFIFAHNEPLQYLFEYGIIGVILAIPVVWNLRKEKWFPVFMFVCVFNWPFRQALFSIWMCWTILTFIRKRDFISSDSLIGL